MKFLLPSNPPHYSEFQLQGFCNNVQFYDFQNPNPPPPQAQLLQYLSHSNTSTSDEADEISLKGVANDQRKQRRMISNRESARRSRARKRKQLDELWSQVVWLRSENHQLLDRLNHASESHDRAVRENVQLKQEASELRQMLCDMQLHSPFSSDSIF